MQISAAPKTTLPRADRREANTDQFRPDACILSFFQPGVFPQRCLRSSQRKEGITMSTPEWLKPGLVGMLAGGVLVAGIGFVGAGWKTAAGAARLGHTMAEEQLVGALVPVCIERAESDPELIPKLATVHQATTVMRQRDALLAAGWATIEGNPSASRTLATACVAALEQRRTALTQAPEHAG
jgi:hypothetical protein